MDLTDNTTVIILLLSVWVVGHFLILGVVFDSQRKLFLVLVTLCLIIVYFTKPATYDLPRYSVYFDTGIMPWLTRSNWQEGGFSRNLLHEDELGEEPYFLHFKNSPGFSHSVYWTARILPHGSYLPRLVKERHIADSLVITIVCSMLIALLIAVRSFRTQKLSIPLHFVRCSYAIPIIIGSAFFFVGSQNSLRQFIGTVLAILAASAVLKNKKIFGMLTLLVSASIHYWGALFALLFLGFLWFNKMPWITLNKTSINRNQVGYLLAFLTGILAVLIIKLGVLLEYSDFKAYFHLDSSAEVQRSTAGFKIVVFTGLLLITDLIAGKTIPDWRFNPVYIRRAFLLFIAPLVVYEEIFSRISFFYLASEMLYVLWAIGNTNRRARLSGAIVFCAYGIAPNALNVLLDKGWKELIFYG